MRAYKFLDESGCTVFSGAKWTLPPGDEPGGWVEAAAVRPCHEGIHACRPDDLAYWLDEELWEIELDGDIHESHRKLVALRGRLVRRVDGWSTGAFAELAEWSAWRARDAAVGVLRESACTAEADTLSSVEALADLGRAGHDIAASLGDTTVAGRAAGLAGDAGVLAPTYRSATVFVAACAAGHAGRGQAGSETDYDATFAAERAVQSAWIVDRLLLA